MQQSAELSITERGILAYRAGADQIDGFSNKERRPAFEPQLWRSGRQRQKQYYSRGKWFTIQWLDLGQPLPTWFDAVMQGLVDLLTLTPGWNSYDAVAIDPDLVTQAVEMSNDLLPQVCNAPAVVPLSSGGLQLEWHRDAASLEIVFDRRERPYFYYCDGQSGEKIEQEIVGNEAIVRNLVAKFD
jgi:hypothetical protein